MSSASPISPLLDVLAREWLDELQRDHPLKRHVSLDWRRFRTTAGVADYRAWSIGLSATLMTDPQRLRTTLRHEYAHLMAVDRFGRKGAGHGDPWKQAMAELGEPPEVRHAYECPRNQPRQVVVYRCAHCGTELHRAREFPRRRRYLHVNCGGYIRFVEKRRVTEDAAAS